MIYRKFNIELTLLRAQLGTNPLSAEIMNDHILARQRKLISENSKLKRSINKYLDALDIPDDRVGIEVDLVIDELERMVGRPFPPEERAQMLAGTLEDLKETFAELDTKGTTIFFKDPATGRPMIGDHMIKGFLKAAGEAIARTQPKKQGAILQSASYTQSIINQHCACSESFLIFDQDILRNKDGSPNYDQRSIRAMTAQGPRISLIRSEQVPAGAKLKFVLKVLDNSPLTEEALRKMFSYGEMVGLGQWRSSSRGSFTFIMEEVIV